MSQGKLEVVKQEMARVNVDILGISEVKWTRKYKRGLKLAHLSLRQESRNSLKLNQFLR